MDDGFFDFREVNFTPSTGVGQLIAQRPQPVPGRVGYDVKGRVLEARQGLDYPLKARSHVEVRREKGVELYLATIDEVVRISVDALKVIWQLAVKGDIDFGPGNLDFRGTCASMAR
ncbi:MAG: DUF342 domain-containing protein [Candidatus Handelsmanbacteria bacterium]|nr:DUF342 domain-containing protein [Candidatus Handelsmanbacteria bacterium]